MLFGINNAISGKIVNSAKAPANTAKNGKLPFKRTLKGNPVIVLVTKRFNPIGGVIIPTSTMRVDTTPSHIVLKPSWLREVSRKGIVKMTILPGSIIIPNINHSR